MVGNTSWNFKGREVGDRSRKETMVFVFRPTKTVSGNIAWLTELRRVSTIESRPLGGVFGAILEFLGFDTSTDEEVIRYEEIER